MSKFVNDCLIVVVFLLFLSLSENIGAQANDVVCDKCINSSDIAGGAVSTSKIKKQAVTTNKIAGGAVTGGKIKNGVIGFNKLTGDVEDAINGSIGGIILEQNTGSDASGVVAFQCPVNSLVGSASCVCDGDGEATNFGVLFGCTVAGNGGVAGCFPESGTFDPQLPVSPATLTLVCVSAVQNDGTPIVPAPVFLNSLGISKVSKGGVDFETATNNARSAAAVYWQSLQNR